MVLDMYCAYARKLIEENPGYWAKYHQRIKCYYVCRCVKENGKSTVEVVISYPEFRKIMETYFTIAKEMIIEGGELNLGHNLGYILARRVERNHRNKMVNFNETRKQPIDPSTGKRERIIYYDDDDWIRIGWEKVGKVPNSRFYRFSPTNDDNHGGGFKKQLSLANQKNPILKYRYKYYPYVLDAAEESKDYVNLDKAFKPAIAS